MFHITAYLAGWRPSDLSKIKYDLIDVINYAFAIPTKDGHLLPLTNQDFVKEAVRTAHENGCKIILSVGGWSHEDIPLEETFDIGTNTPEKVHTMVQDIMTTVNAFDFDGADIDWEYPRIHSKDQCEALFVSLKKELEPLGKSLTCAVYAGVSSRNNGLDGLGNPVEDIVYGLTDAALAACDYINIMAYDGGNCELHSSFGFAYRSGEMWKEERHVPAEKLVLGVPFYGRPGGGYKGILEKNPEAYRTDICLADGKLAYYNGRETMRQKTLYAKESLGGVMIWEIQQDPEDRQDSLLQLIYDTAN